MTRATLRFTSESGIEYLYDDVTGNIFPWSSLEEVLLKQELDNALTDSEKSLIQTYSSAEILAKTGHIRRWRNQYHAYARPSHQGFSVPVPDQMAPLVWSNVMVLILIITENCNLKCRYCSFASGSYKYNRQPTTRTMSCAQAIKAVDWFVEGVSANRARNPRKQYGLSFYGGEPLLNIKLIREILEYAEKKYPGLFFPVLTTNGLLLTADNVKILRDHSVHMAISIDGPEDEHDRLRVDLHDQGTFKRITRNLAEIKTLYPDYWNAHIVSLSVYDPRSDITKISQFFDDNKEVIPPSTFVNAVSGHNSDYYTRFTQDDYALFGTRLKSLRQQYKRLETNGKQAGSYCTVIAGSPIMLLLLRTRVADAKVAYIPYTGCCVPGLRMAVGVDGTLNMCERVNGTFPIGHLDEGGLRYEKIAELIRQYQEKVMHKCAGCPVTRLCSLCFAYCETNGGVAEPSGWCESTIEETRKNLADYISMLESNSQLADNAFHTDIFTLLRNRLLFQS